MERRDFLKQSGLAAGIGLSSPARASSRPIALAVDPMDKVAASAPAIWALGELRRDLASAGYTVRDIRRAQEAKPGELCLAVAGDSSQAPDAFNIGPAAGRGLGFVEVGGGGERGLVYALTALAERARLGRDLSVPERDSPVNQVRSAARFFVSDVEDKPWFNDRDFWRAYLTNLAVHRFNRFNFTLGIGYDFARQIRDCYFHFPYPFLMDVKGYHVRAKGLPDDERDSNFAMLKFMAKETVARGLQFHLGLWTHAYQWTDSPHANYIIEGLTPETQASYCRDALARILSEVPEISGLTFRVHGESGVAEGSYGFWGTLFGAAKDSGRRIPLDLHAKGIDRKMIDTALATGLPVSISPKFMAEHMGLPYQQAGIRELEMPPREARQGFFALSDGERKFMRYSYGDLFDEKRRYSVQFRIWPGTQRLLLWGDPEFAAAYGKAFQFCGATGAEWCEPLSFKGRKGGGLPGGRTGLSDPALIPKYDFQKYEYSYKLWGHALYNPSTVPPAGSPAEKALASASRILPLITSAHGPSAANNNYWPEMYYNMSIVDPKVRNPYGDSPAPRVFGTVSPFDPEIFAGIVEYVEDRGGAKHTPLEVANWLDELADAAQKGEAPRAWAVDIRIQAGIGRFFAAKFRAAVMYERYARDQDRAKLAAAIENYRLAQSHWAGLANVAKGVYHPDVTFGYEYQLRGHWLDRLTAIDEDIARMEKLQGDDPLPPAAKVSVAVRPSWNCRHTPPGDFRPGAAIELALAVEPPAPAAVRLRYRHVNQVERFAAIAMTRAGNAYQAVIPAEYTSSPFPLQYYFELHAEDSAALYPGLGPKLTNQPYFVIRQSGH